MDEGLIEYLKTKKIKIQAGHCLSGNLQNIDATTHTFNAMSGINHRENSTSLSALIDDNIYTEIIADGMHISDEIIKLVFKSKPIDKILLISDALPITYSDLREFIFADSKIFYNGEKAVSKNGTIAGSTMLIDKMIKRLAELNLFQKELIENTYKYHSIEPYGQIEWDDDFNIKHIEYKGLTVL